MYCDSRTVKIERMRDGKLYLHKNDKNTTLLPPPQSAKLYGLSCESSCCLMYLYR